MPPIEYASPTGSETITLMDEEAGRDRVSAAAEASGVSYPVAAAFMTSKHGGGPGDAVPSIPVAPVDMPRHPCLAWDSMARFVSTVLSASESGKPIGVYGDYDGDGVTSSLILTMSLRLLGIAVVNEFSSVADGGFGLSSAGVRRLAEAGCGAVVVVDTGTNSADELREAVGLGMPVVVSDHHIPSGSFEPVPGVTYLNPHIELSGRAASELRNAGLAFYMAEALAIATGGPSPASDPVLLGLAGLGTFADASSQSDGPHAAWLLRNGLSPEALSSIAGFGSLFGVKPERVLLDSGEPKVAEGFRKMSLGKRISSFSPADVLAILDPGTGTDERDAAAGRVDKAYSSYQLAVEAAMPGLADDAARCDGISVAIARGVHPDFAGIRGTLAAKLAYSTERPAFVFVESGGVFQGSWRMGSSGIDGEDLMRQVDAEAPGLLLGFGGHAAAGGVQVRHAGDVPILEFLIGKASGFVAGARRGWAKGGTSATSEWDLSRDGDAIGGCLALAPFSRYSVKKPSFLIRDAVATGTSRDDSGRWLDVTQGESRISVAEGRKAPPLIGQPFDAVVSVAWAGGEYRPVLLAWFPSENRIGS